MLLSIVIPLCNERRTLGAVLATVARALLVISKEVIVVDDCSKGGTREWSNANFPDDPRSGDPGARLALRCTPGEILTQKPTESQLG